MKYEFSDIEKKDKLNVAQLEDLEFICDYVEGSGTSYRAVGTAIVEGEVYTSFEIEITLEKEAESLSADGVFNGEWLEYDYVFPV